MLFNKYIRFIYFTLGFTLPIVAAFTLLQKPLNAQSSESVNSEKFSPVPVQPIQLTQLELNPEKSSPIPLTSNIISNKIFHSELSKIQFRL